MFTAEMSIRREWVEDTLAGNFLGFPERLDDMQHAT